MRLCEEYALNESDEEGSSRIWPSLERVVCGAHRNDRRQYGIETVKEIPVLRQAGVRGLSWGRSLQFIKQRS